MNFFSVISALLFLLYLQLGIYVLYRSPWARLNQFFFLLCLSFSLWSFAYIFMYSAPDEESVRFWDRMASPGYIMFPVFMASFNIHLCHCSRSSVVPIALFLTMFSLGAVLSVTSLADLWVPDDVIMGKFTWQLRYPKFDGYYILYVIHMIISTLITIFFIARWRSRLEDKTQIVQFRYYFFPLMVFFLLIIIIDVILPMTKVDVLPNMAHISSLPWLAAVGYVMLKYQLMTVNPNSLIADTIVRQIKEIVLFIDSGKIVVRSNLFTQKLLTGVSNNLEGESIFNFFENKTLLTGFLKRSREKGQIGPEVLMMKDYSENHIEANLYFIAIHDSFNDFQGHIIYGHDNREAINLQKEIIVREHAEHNLRAISDVLEMRVKERTAELTSSYKELQVKMTEKMKVEEQIKADIAEKEVLINEIHNRVKSNMDIIISLILAYEKESLSPAASRKFRELARRVKSLLLVHNNLYLSISYSDVDFSNFIRSLSDELLVFYKRTGKVDIRFDISDVFLDVDYAIPVGIIVNELLSNSLQHAFSDYFLKKHPGRNNLILIEYKITNNKYQITIADNGKGMPDGFDISQLTTNGLPLTEILVKDQVNGELEIHSSADGTLIKVTFVATK